MLSWNWSLRNWSSDWYTIATVKIFPIIHLESICYLNYGEVLVLLSTVLKGFCRTAPHRYRATLLKSHFSMGFSCKTAAYFRIPFPNNTSGKLLTCVGAVDRFAPRKEKIPEEILCLSWKETLRKPIQKEVVCETNF